MGGADGEEGVGLLGAHGHHCCPALPGQRHGQEEDHRFVFKSLLNVVVFNILSLFCPRGLDGGGPLFNMSPWRLVNDLNHLTRFCMPTVVPPSLLHSRG